MLLLAALISVTLIGRNMDAVGGGLQRNEQEAAGTQGVEDRLLDEVARLHDRLAVLEQRLDVKR